MREPRIYTNQPLGPERDVTLDIRAIHHLRMVLRLRDGATVRLFNGDGQEYLGSLVEMRQERTRVHITAILATEPATALQLHLLLGISKGERMDTAIQKAVELGVTRLSPILAKRNVVQIQGERLERRCQHWQQVVIAACEQSGRCRIPKLDEPSSLENALDAIDADRCLVLYHLGTATLHTIAPPTRGVAILIGPEGGLELDEIKIAESCGFVPLRLGPRILRTETAPLAALAAVQALWGDFRGA